MNKRTIYLIVSLSFMLGVFTDTQAQPELDISFNGTGRSTVDFSPLDDQAYEVLVQPDNKIIQIGTMRAGNSPRYFALTRYNTDGSLDTSFGEFGRIITDFNADAPNEGAYAGAIQPDGKIIAAGYVSIISPGEGYLAMVRYNTDGSIDTTFGNGGKVLSSVVQHINEIRAVAVGPDGKIVVAGLYFNGTSFQSVVVKYSANGTAEWSKTDTRGGILGDWNIPQAVAVQPDGNIITAGYFAPSGGAADITLVRYTSAGAYDTSFGAGGRLLISSPTVNEVANDICLYPDGRILLAGTSGPDFLLIRMFGNGMQDISFSGDGRITTPMGGTAQATAVDVRPNGRILVSGSTTPFATGFALAAYTPDGLLDTSFSGDGKLAFGFTDPGGSAATSMAIDGLGRIVIGGISGGYFAAARLYTLQPAPVSVSGRTMDTNGTPLRGVRVGLTDASGMTRWAITSNFGFFSFDNVPTGQTYNLFVRGSKTHIFELRDIGLNEAVENLELIGVPRESKTAPVSGTSIRKAQK